MFRPRAGVGRTRKRQVDDIVVGNGNADGGSAGEAIEVRDDELVDARRAHRAQGVAREHRVEWADPERPLPRMVSILRVGQRVGEGGVFGGQRPGTVACRVGPQHTHARRGEIAAELVEHGVRGLEGRSARRHIRPKTVMAIEQDTLGAFEDGGGAEIGRLGQRDAASDHGRVVLDEPGHSVGAAQVCEGRAEFGPNLVARRCGDNLFGEIDLHVPLQR